MYFRLRHVRACQVTDDLIHPAIRRGDKPARIELHRRNVSTNAFLLRAIEIMEMHVEEPITLTLFGKKVGTSVRHLERLFSRSLGTSPSKYYMRLRLREASGLLMQTEIPLVQVASVAGFTIPLASPADTMTSTRSCLATSAVRCIRRQCSEMSHRCRRTADLSRWCVRPKSITAKGVWGSR